MDNERRNIYFSHPEDTSEGSAKLINSSDSSLSLKMTLLYFDFDSFSKKIYSMKYGLQGKLFAQSGKGNELASILVEAAELMKSAKGCHIYIVGQQAENKHTVCISEVWDSKEAHNESLNLPGVRELIGRAMPILEGQPESFEVDIIGGQGL
ncbi:MAG: putative quinol monooxygenase [Balneolaceae bacterium]